MKHIFPEHQIQAQTDDIIFRTNHHGPFDHKSDDITRPSYKQQLLLAHKGHREHGMWGYHMALCYMSCLSNFPPEAYQWPSWKDRTKDGSYPVISSAEVKEIQPSQTSHPATRVRDMWHDTTHIWRGISPRLRPDTSSVESLWVCVSVGSDLSGGGTDKAESVFVMRICY